MAKMVALGKQLYLFTVNDDGKSSGKLVITSHGGWEGGNGHFNVPEWTTLHFLNPDNTILSERGLGQVMIGQLRIYETAGPGITLRNYGLSKYQGRHGSEDETYHEIQRLLRVEALDMDMDVLTIRFRRGRSSPTLKDVLKVLKRNDRCYANIICSFCRSSGVLSEQYDASQAKEGTWIKDFEFRNDML